MQEKCHRAIWFAVGCRKSRRGSIPVRSGAFRADRATAGLPTSLPAFAIGQRKCFDVSLRMFKPICLLITGLLAAGTLFAKPRRKNRPRPTDATKPTAEQSASSRRRPKRGRSDDSRQEKSAAARPEEHGHVGQATGRFYLYANGNWIKNNPVPPEFSRWAAFNQLAEKNNDALHEIAEKAAAAAPKDSKQSKMEKAAIADVQKVGDFYASGMDEKAVDAAQGEAARGRVQADRCDERSQGCAQGNRAFPCDGSERVLLFHLRPGRQEQHDGDRAGLPGRPRNAGPRLLHEGRRRFEKIARPIRRARHENVDAGRGAGRPRRPRTRKK